MSEENVNNIAETVDTEQNIPQSKVNAIVAAAKRETAAKVRAETEAEFRNILASMVPTPDTTVPEKVSEADAGLDIRSEIKKEMESQFSALSSQMSKKEAERLATEEFNAFVHKLGDTPFSEEIQTIINDSEYDLRPLTNIVPILNELENPREVFDHLMLHPAQLAVLESCVKQSPRQARREAKRLAEALRQNRKETTTPVKEPIQKINNFNVGSSSSNIVDPSKSGMSVADFRKYFTSRRR